MTIRTLADVRDLIERHLPAETREKVTWQYLSRLLAEASLSADMVDVALVLRMVRGFEDVECQPINEVIQSRAGTDHNLPN
jgi:hypothetical protein